jgi:hypothetical protein
MGPFHLKKIKVASISGISGSVAILKIFYLNLEQSTTNFCTNTILGNQKVSNERSP